MVDVLEVAAVTDKGQVRRSNQDTISVAGWVNSADEGEPIRFRRSSETPALFLVADGMGGHQAGDRASVIAATTLNACLQTLIDSNAETSLDVRVDDALQSANRAIYTEMEAFPERAGMGTTVAAVVIHRHKALVFNVGDSRIYSFGADLALRQLSIDDSPAAVTGEPEKTITQALGGSSEIRAGGFDGHARVTEISPGDLLLLCSDGLTDFVSVSTIEQTIRTERKLETIVGCLLASAIARGSDDNISVVAIRGHANTTSQPRNVDEPESIRKQSRFRRKRTT